MTSSDLFSVAGRIAFITGGSSGIGSYIALGLAQAGAARVYIAGRRAANLEAVAARVPESAAGVLVPRVGEVSTIDGCRALARAFVEAERARMGAGAEVKLDLLVNNAGMMAQEGRWAHGTSVEEIGEALLEASDADWAQVFAVNAGSLQVRKGFFSVRWLLLRGGLRWVVALRGAAALSCERG